MSLRKTITEKEITYIHIHIEYDPKRPDISAVIIFILSATNLLPAAYGNFILSITTPQLI